MRRSWFLLMALLCGCALSASDYSPKALQQSFTMKDTSIHYRPDVLQVGAPQADVHAAFGEPNATRTLPGGKLQEAYAFNPDGSKFVNPKVRPRNIAAAFFTAGASAAVHAARVLHAEHQLTVYRVTYNGGSRIQSVEVSAPNGPSSGQQGQTTAAPPPSGQAQ